MMSLALLLALAAGDWSQPRADAANTAWVELDAPKSERPRAWTFEGAARVVGYEPGMTTWSSPAVGVVDGRATLFVGGYDHLVYALDAATGEVRWKYTTGDGIYSTPLPWRDGERLVIFVASNDRELYALDATSGKRLWSTLLEPYSPTLGGARLAGPCLGRVQGAPALFVGVWVHDASLTANLQRGTMVALAAKDGARLWSTALGDNELTAPTCAPDGVFVGSANGNLSALDMETGHVRWTHTEHDGIRSAPAVAKRSDGIEVVITGSRYGEARALDAKSGNELWRLKTADRIIGSPAVTLLGDRLVALIPSYDRHLYALDLTSGAVIWRAKARGGFLNSPAVVPGATPTVLALAWDHTLHGVDAATGEERFSFFTGRPLWDVGGLDASNWSSPAVARFNGENVVFVGSYDGRLRAIPLETRPPPDPTTHRALVFWLSFPTTIAPLVLAALWLTRRFRRARHTAAATQDTPLRTPGAPQVQPRPPETAPRRGTAGG